MIDIGEARGAPVADGTVVPAAREVREVREVRDAREAPSPAHAVVTSAASTSTFAASAAGLIVPAKAVVPVVSDVISVPEAAGREALRRLLAYAQPAVAPGPVAVTPDGRVLFHVAPGGCQDLPELLDWLDWGGVQLDLLPHPPGGGAERPVEWLHPADTEPPELVALLATIATACHRLAVMRGSRTGRDLRRPG